MDTENKYGTLSIQSELLPMLKEFHKFCIEKGIHYSLAYGSLLGTVRHKGFIPWDDDADIIMTRDNFKKICNEIFDSPQFQWDYLSENSIWVAKVRKSNQEIHTDYPPTFDIFILDNVPDNIILAKIKLLLLLLLQGMIKKKPDLSKFKPFMKFCAYSTCLMGKLLPTKKKITMYEKISEWGDSKKTKKISCYNTIFGYMGRNFSSTMMEKYSLCPFEDTELMIMDGYDEFLTTTYGDYMTPPDNKVGHHLHPEYSFSYK